MSKKNAEIHTDKSALLEEEEDLRRSSLTCVFTFTGTRGTV